MDLELQEEVEREIDNYRSRRKSQKWDDIEKIMEDTGLNRQLAMRIYVISRYGDKCLLCKEDRNPVLDLHHVKGGGTDHVKLLGGRSRFLYWIIENNFPPEIVVLCANCHRMLHYMERNSG